MSYVVAVGIMACVRPSAPTPVSVPTVAPSTPSVAPAAPTASAPAPKDTVAVQQAVPAVATKPVASDSQQVSDADVTRRAVEVFGDSAVAVAHVDSAVEPNWDIDVRSYESTDRVAHYVQFFSGPAKDRIAARLERGTRYEPMIRAAMRAGGLPEDMYYLALIESGFDPNAYSRAAAVGMWQFMTSTGRDMGLRVDWWVDERRDPVKSTYAAVRFIKGLKEQFGSLYLAAAAYNGGPGRIARGLTRYADDLEGTTGDDLFFALAGKDYLRNETREYVPQLIAAALIAKEPARYGMTITPQPPFAYDTVRVGPATPLAAIARASSASVSAIQELNPQVLRGMTPPRDSFEVRVPSGAADGFSAAFDSLPKSMRTGLLAVESKKGQSLASIADKTGINVHQLALFNPTLKRLKSGNLVPGQTVVVPTGAVSAAAVSVPDPSIERYSTSRATTMHVVAHGETLSGIAKKYHTTTGALMRENGLKRALIFPGQTLAIGGSSSSKSTKSSTASASTAKKHAAKSSSAAVASKSAGKKKSLAKASPTKKPVAKKAH